MIEQEQSAPIERTTVSSIQGGTLKQKLTSILNANAKWMSILACLFVTLITFLSRYVYDPVKYDFPVLRSITLDVEYVVSMGKLLEQGKIAGRDFHFTYGFIGQLFFTIPRLTIGGLYEMVYPFTFVGFAFYWSLFAIFLFSIKKLDWKYSAFICLLFLFMQYIEWNTSRAIVLLFPAVVLVKALKTFNWKARIIWSIATGLLCFAGFLFTYEIGVYTILACGGVCVGLIILGLTNKRWQIPDLIQPTQAGAIAGIILATFLLSNLLLSIIFKLTSPDYENLFDFQYYALEMIRGYTQVMGRVDDFNLLKLIIVLLMIAYLSWFIIVNLKVLPIAETYLFLALFVTSLTQVKTLLSRSSAPFVIFLCLPLVFVIAGFPGWKARRNRFCWTAILVLYVASWGSFASTPFTAMTTFLEGKDNVPGKIEDSLKPTRLDPKLVSGQVKNLLDANPQVKLFTFPYQYSQALAFGKQNPHPLIQSYLGMTFPLQDKVVHELEQSLPDVEVLFSAEAPNKGSELVDDTPDPTRTPRIFEYLFSRFEVKQDVLIDERMLVLKARATPRGFEGVPLDYDYDGTVVRLKQTTSCTLLRLTSTVDYPMTRQLTRPNPLMAVIGLDAEMLMVVRIVPLEIGKSFSTYIPLYQRNGQNYREMFANRSVTGSELNNLRLAPVDSGYLGVDPSSIKVEKIECIQL